jgi:hypothetical protein
VIRARARVGIIDNENHSQIGCWAYLISYGKDLRMSLPVSPDLLDRARHGDVDDTAFTACIQDCHRVAVFRPDATRALAEFTTALAQILNQSPELTNC